MKEINLDQLFQDLNQEATEVQISEITEWVMNIKSPGFRYKIAASILGFSIILIVFYSFLNINEPRLMIKKNKIASNLHIEPVAPNKLISQQKELPLEEFIFQENNELLDVVSTMEPIKVFSFDKLPIKPLNKSVSTILNKNNVSKNGIWAFLNLNNNQSIVYDSVIPRQNSLYILDTVQNYRSNRMLGMDEKDCYLQIINDYVVISFRFRGSTVFKSGKIYESGIMKLEGKQYHIYGFVCDNRYSQTNFGQRNFFGISESIGNSADILIFGFNWNPSYTIHAHPASDIERKGLVDRSNLQKNL